MKPISKGILAVAAAAVALGLPSCADENPWSGSQGLGGIKLTLAPSPNYVEGAPSTRAPESLFAVPDASDFSLKLEKIDGSFSKEWNSLAEFESEEGFPAGAYTLTAFYGSIEDEGFEKPHFLGSEQLTVLEDKETSVDIEAVLANTLVSVEYTDAFKNYFTSWSAEVHSEGHGYNAVPGDETRPVFVAPGSVDIAVDFTDPQNRNAKVQAASFEALARHHYHVTIDVNNGNVGGAQIVISFDDSVEEEHIFIDLTDELFTTPSPTLTAEGFEPDQTIDLLEGAAASAPLKFNAMARAGITSAVLTIASETFTPAFGKEIDLCKATPAQQEQLLGLGINVIGLYKNPGVFGVIDFTALPSALPAGHHTVSMIVKDKFNRVSDPMSVTFDSEAVGLSISAEPSVFGTNEAVINVGFNGGDPSGDVTFKMMDNLGAYVDLPVISSVRGENTRALPVQNWLMTVRLQDSERNPIPIKAYYKGVEKASFEIKVVYPSFSCEVDPLASKALIKLTTDDPAVQRAVLNAVKPVLTGPGASSATFSRNVNEGLLTLSGLTPSSGYTLALTLGSVRTDAGSFTTEAAAALPNGDFSATSQLEVAELQIGGIFNVDALGIKRSYKHKSSISRAVPQGWATLNDLTCWTGSSNYNTWFLVPSTYVEDGGCVIRSVGYHHDGTNPAGSGGNFNTKYYCENAPAELERSSGELFLGEYSFTGGRTDGITFTSRPSSLTFDYSYSPFGGETAQVAVVLYDASGAVIASKTDNLGASGTTSHTISLPSYPFGKKAAKIRVSFRSTAGDEIGLNIPTGSALNEGLGLTNGTKGANDYKAFASGSVLTVSNVKLNY